MTGLRQGTARAAQPPSTEPPLGQRGRRGSAQLSSAPHTGPIRRQTPPCLGSANRQPRASQDQLLPIIWVTDSAIPGLGATGGAPCTALARLRSGTHNTANHREAPTPTGPGLACFHTHPRSCKQPLPPPSPHSPPHPPSTKKGREQVLDKPRRTAPRAAPPAGAALATGVPVWLVEAQAQPLGAANRLLSPPHTLRVAPGPPAQCQLCPSEQAGVLAGAGFLPRATLSRPGGKVSATGRHAGTVPPGLLIATRGSLQAGGGAAAGRREGQAPPGSSSSEGWTQAQILPLVQGTSHSQPRHTGGSLHSCFLGAGGGGEEYSLPAFRGSPGEEEEFICSTSAAGDRRTGLGLLWSPAPFPSAAGHAQPPPAPETSSHSPQPKVLLRLLGSPHSAATRRPSWLPRPGLAAAPPGWAGGGGRSCRGHG